MPTIIPRASTTTKNKRAKGRATNGRSSLTLANLKFPTYLEVREEIDKKVGTRPLRPRELPKGRWTEQALKVLQERYLKKDEKGETVETPEDMVWRVSWEVASAEARWGKTRKQVMEAAKEFYGLMTSREFLPNSPTLMNAGTGNMLQYSACFVLPVEDSIEGIFDALKYQALIHKSGGGTGFSFSRLRPTGSMVKSSSGTASGPISFMRIFDAATNEVKQGGKRRGANMGILRVDHPDIMEFIHCKEEGGITNFNISAAVTDKFMEAYRKNKDYKLIDPRTKKTVGKANARKVFDEIAEGAWKTGDPGLVFIDRRNRGSSNPVPALGPIEATNPCGEQELYPFDACNLGSIFLTYFVKENPSTGSGPKREVDWDKLKKITAVATRFLDDVIEVNPYPLEQIRQTVLGIRRIGLGVGGWADMLVELGIPYDSREALSLADKIMKTIQDEAVRASTELALERGPFPLWPISIYREKAPRRNSTVTTIAPTGTISIIAGASSGIEPLFAIAFQHIVRDKHLNRKLSFVNPKFEEIAKSRGFWSEEIKAKVAEKGVIRGIEEIPAEVRALFGTAHEIAPEWHVRVQAVFQKYTENAVSKTINLGHDSTVDDIKKAYLMAWETDCKGITVFRDGSKDAQVLNLGLKEGQKNEEESAEPLKLRPFKVIGSTYRLQTPVGNAFITINQDEAGDPLEIFINVGKAGSDVAAMAEALGRTISTTLRFRGSLSAKDRAYEIAKQLAGIGGRRSVGFGPNKIRSLPDAISAALSSHYGFKVNGNGNHSILEIGNGAALAASNVAGAVMAAVLPSPKGMGQAPLESLNDPTTASASFNEAQAAIGDICPSCGASSLVYEEGCSKCYSCGHSEC
ncbi:MAG: Ribonucleoside-diphosphate reductase [Candidatus Woesebacteria bacterium GW2011_GWC2_47_16]|uniref:Vitamin B12-dependent ribonucleotide reductase n=8 Tax=Candidatus Woeseibacteriota TaxID=1752722 RepID=A0A0G1SPA9_9BACT|nr:MAG: Ribonucleoside-diphosphate reductase [Candidatus Woesebacteria bacterium GW2011_GWE1_45_18]KKU65305.1 MAG: Ribonucleoside-diphosphate reductase [Candidatus Woesebacteria bacterium GW2011_GWC2_47_16]KKU71276.1 MAG: Ribonucleoside-diphosphate reductase [Candidatus Woesebacteria bacterium GW2011_GWD1_47_21]OGM84622.1 MAG: ribonucleoside-diphosphate reductase, adenosylcobalamin-dependent [Candidatus Woesebacteria bacterium RIFOXYB1_FULL_47_31]OGM85192.1 MAG: ribonucleoside-diphosphate reduc